MNLEMGQTLLCGQQSRLVCGPGLGFSGDWRYWCEIGWACLRSRPLVGVGNEGLDEMLCAVCQKLRC